MNDQVYDDLAVERIMVDNFGVRAEVGQVIVRDIPVSRTARATVFLTDKKQLYTLLSAEAKMSLGDVQKIITRMGLKAELFVPPKHQPEYFDAYGREKFRQTFPGKRTVTDDDIRFYRTLASYNPALVLIHEVRDGQVYRYDADASGGWRVAAKFAYRRIKTS
ncbi:MAG TPA: hypothetical protein VFQ70_04640 [Candidatus Saccharimonadaceae bacterium]|nr:hypothetical protein [Candidatus Saccharimonadaceae bacterium]